MSDQVSRLAALVNRLTGQVTGLQDEVRTLSEGSEAKLADLTRRVSMSEVEERGRGCGAGERLAGGGLGCNLRRQGRRAGAGRAD